MSRRMVYGLLFVIFMDFYGGFPVIGMLALVFLIIRFFTYFFSSIFSRKKISYLMILLPILIVFLDIRTLFLIADFNRIEGIKKGNIIIKALEEFKLKTGQYPGSLSELVPEYLNEIPRPKILSFRNEFRYLADNHCHLKSCQDDQIGLRSRFFLYFENSYIENKDYDSNDKVWITMVR